jgi:hypothetical protein
MRCLVVAACAGLVLSWQTSSVAAGDAPLGPLPVQPASVASAAEAATVAAPANSASAGFAGSDNANRGGHVVGGVGLYFLKPQFENNPAFTATAVKSVLTSAVTQDMFHTIENTSTTTSVIQQDFSYDLTVSPLIYLGYVGDGGLGFRTRWFRFDQGADASTTNGRQSNLSSVAPGGLNGLSPASVAVSSEGQVDSLAFTSHLVLEVWDFEATQDLQVGNWSFLGTGGVRYLHMAQRFAAHKSPLQPPAQFTTDAPETLVSGHSFNGVGPTLALEAERPLGSSGLSLYGTARGAVLFGTGKQSATGQTTTVNALRFETVINSQTTVDDTRRSDVLPVLEFEVGVQYGREVGQFYPFVRTGLVGQAYFGAGSATSEDGNLGLFGLSVTAGLHF